MLLKIYLAIYTSHEYIFTTVKVMICCTLNTTIISLYAPFYVFILTGIVCNVLLLVGLKRDPLKCFRNFTSYLIMNLSVSDILTCLCRLAEVHCSFGGDGKWYFLLHFPIYVSLFCNFFLAFDRYLITVFPLKYKILITWRITLAVILMQWVLPCGVIGIELSYANSRFGVYCINAFVMIILASGLYLYTKTAWVLNRQAKFWKNQPQNFHINRVQNQRRFFLTICLVSGATLASTIPFVTYDSLTSTGSIDEHLEKPRNDKIYVLLSILFVVNFTMNPLLYVWRLRSYRATARNLFCSG